MRKRSQIRAGAVEKSVLAIVRHQEELRTKPATDVQLARLWPPWNALPSKLLAEEKCRILTLDQRDEPQPDPRRSAQAKELRRQFNYLPLDPNEYNQALKRACRWAGLLHFDQTTQTLHHALVTRQWAFAEADGQAAGRVALFRAANELRLVRPGFMELTAPTLADIALLDDRFAAYSNAREQALAAVAELVFKFPGIRTGKALPLHQRALGIPHPPYDVPRYLYIARLDALGICSQERLNDFLRDELPKLAWSKRLKFERIRRKPRYGKNPYAGLLVWVLENRPIFENEKFGWQWKDILKVAQEKLIHCPKEYLKQWAYRSRVHLNVKLGNSFCDAQGIKLSARILSPAPVFGDALKPATGCA